MAPSTRLGARPERRVNYTYEALTGRSESLRNRIVENVQPHHTPAARLARPIDNTTRVLIRNANGSFTKSEAVSRQKQDYKKVVKVTTPPKHKTKMRPEKTECVICATTKETKRCFKVPDDEMTCGHFDHVCNLCIQKQIKIKIAERQLTDAHLVCMFQGCEAVLDHTALKKVMTNSLFET
jgi:hypothetical protein